MAKQKTVSTRVTQGEDGKYRWVYAMSLYKNPTVFFLVWKIFFFIFLAVFAVVILSDVRWGWQHIINDLKFLGYFLIGMTAVTGTGYLLYAAMMGGQYIVEFEMDEKGVLHKQTDAQAKKAQKISRAAVAAGAASGRLTTAGAGMNAANTEMYSDFTKVRKIKAYPRRHLLKVSAPLQHNQVYVTQEDFAFVRDFIVVHCPDVP